MFFEKGMNYAEIAQGHGARRKDGEKSIHMDNFNAPPPKPVKRQGSKLDRFKPEIDSWLEADKEERKSSAIPRCGSANRRLLVLCDQDMQRRHYLKGELISELFEEDLKALERICSIC